jgi:hypothetical protein
MGFELYGNNNHAYKILDKVLEIPSDGAEVEVITKLYQECKGWDPNAHPLMCFGQKALKTDNNIVHLCKRINIPTFFDLWDTDVIVRIIVGVKEIYCDKAKYKKAGLERCENGFFFERIYLK